MENAQPVPAPRGREQGAISGALAALLAVFLDLLWRSSLAPPGVPAIPESIVAAVARLTPTSLFGWATENFGSLAQNSLFAASIAGIVLAGAVAGRIVASWEHAARRGGKLSRLTAAVSMAVLLFLVIAVVVFPLAREGIFASSSVRQVSMLLQAAGFAAIWALGWIALATGEEEMTPTSETRNPEVSRRRALQTVIGAGLTAGIAVVGWRLAKSPDRVDAATQDEAANEIKTRARLAAANATEPATATADDIAGLSAIEALQDNNPEAAFDALEAEGKLTPVITSVANFYHVSKNIGDPVVDAANWTLSIAGKVEKPLTFSYQDILDRSKMSNITTLSCISNELNGDLAGTAEWSGFPLRTLLEEAKVDPATVDIVFRAADGYDDSIPLQQAMHPSTMVVTGMNGEPLPPDHGFPARIIVPPIYGMKNVKWLESIEAVDTDYQGYWQTRGWSDPAPYQIWGRIDTPAPGEELAAGDAVAAGVASAGDRGIFQVEVSLDGGETWADATLEPSINPDFTWVRWVFPFTATAGTMTLLMRATDGEGNVAPEERRPPLPDGATGWPDRTFRVAG